MKKLELFTEGERTLQQTIDEFLLDCSVRNLSSATIKTYKDHFHMLSMNVDLMKPIFSITSDDINVFVMYLLDNGKRDTTINSYLRSIRAMLYWAMKKHYLKSFTISKLKEDKTFKQPYTDEELYVLLKKPNRNTCTFMEYRTWALSCFLASTGQRLGAVIKLTVNDIDLKSSFITFKRTKKRSSHTILIPDSLKPILVEYISTLKQYNIEFLFPNAYGKEAKERTIQCNLADYNRKRGVNKTSAHLYRHTFAKNWISSGCNQIELMRILDHSTLDMTNHYVNLYSSDVDINKCDIISKYTSKKIKLR